MQPIWKWILGLASLLMVLGCLESDPVGGDIQGPETSSASQAEIEIQDCIDVDENGIIVIYFNTTQLDTSLFKDPALIKYFQEYIESAGTDCFNQQTLLLYQKNISDLTGFEQFENSNLLSLHLGANQISDISGLPILPNLQGLSLFNNHISKVNRFPVLPNLQWLDLYNNQISDISGLPVLPNLQELDLYGNPNMDCESIKDLEVRMPNCVIYEPSHCY